MLQETQYPDARDKGNLSSTMEDGKGDKRSPLANIIVLFCTVSLLLCSFHTNSLWMLSLKHNILFFYERRCQIT